MKDRVLKWIEQGCDYNTGILLLADSGHHRQLIRIIANRPHRYASKLLYELCKEAGIPYMDLGHADLLIRTNPGQADSLKRNLSSIQADFIHSGQADVKKYHEKNDLEILPTNDNKSLSLDGIHNCTLTRNENFIQGIQRISEEGKFDNSKSEGISEKDQGSRQYSKNLFQDKSNPITKGEKRGITCLSPGLNSAQELNRLPSDVQKVIREHSKLFMLRSQLHEQMANMPEDNQPGTVKKRKNLSDSIALLSPRIDLLFQIKEDFYLKGLKPDMAVLFPTIPSDDSQTTKETPLPDSAKELKKLKKNLQSANVKDQNMLDYQEETKATKPSPMPSGPKRLKLEQRIASRHNQIEAIDYKLLTVE